MSLHRLTRAALAATLVFLAACATTPPHPTPDRPISGCYITCPSGYFARRQHICRGSTRWLEDIRITGEEDVPGDPSRSRWFTGLTSRWADYEVEQRLTKAGLTKASPDWGRRYGEELKAVRHELGDEARAAYFKIDVELGPCRAFRDRSCGASGDCATHPGEDGLGRWSTPP